MNPLEMLKKVQMKKKMKEGTAAEEKKELSKKESKEVAKGKGDKKDLYKGKK